MRRASVTLLCVLAVGLVSVGSPGLHVRVPQAPTAVDRALEAAAPVVEVPVPASARPAPAPARIDPAVAEVAELLARGRVLVPEEITRVAEALVAESRRLGFSPSLVLAVIEVESRFDPFAISEDGAIGLMQVLPSTARPVAADLGIEWRAERTLFDPIQNLRIGLAYLAQLRDRFEHLPTALAAYNRGPAAIGRRVRRGASIPQGYVKRVLAADAEARARMSTSS